MLLQKIHSEKEKAKSGNGLKVVFYLLSLAVAFAFGHYEGAKDHASTADTTQQAPPAAAPIPLPMTPSEAADTVPVSTPAVVRSATPALITMAETTPVRVEKAIAVTPSTAPSAAPAPSADPVKPANTVTITEAVQIPVKQGNKITGYINLQKGQVVTAIEVDHDEIKIKSGESFVMVPVKSTDMAH